MSARTSTPAPLASPSLVLRARLRRRDATPVARSVLVGSHHLDGFLRSCVPACCSRYRIWGSPGVPRIVRRSDRPPERSFGLGSCAGVPVARHPAKVSSSSAAVPHHCGLLPSCRSSPPVTRAFARVPVKLHSDRGHRIAADPGWTARLPPASSLAAFLPRSATSVGRRSSGIGAASRFRARSLDLRVRPPTLASPRGDRARSGSLRAGCVVGLSSVLSDEGGAAGSGTARAAPFLLDLRSVGPPVSGWAP
jgi:hypothetical protein